MCSPKRSEFGCKRRISVVLPTWSTLAHSIYFSNLFCFPFSGHSEIVIVYPLAESHSILLTNSFLVINGTVASPRSHPVRVSQYVPKFVSNLSFSIWRDVWRIWQEITLKLATRSEDAKVPTANDCLFISHGWRTELWCTPVRLYSDWPLNTSMTRHASDLMKWFRHSSLMFNSGQKMRPGSCGP